MDIYDAVYSILLYIIYPVCIVFIGLEVHRYVYMHYVLVDNDNEFHEPTIEMCSRCKNPDCSRRIVYYLEEEDHD